MLYLMLQVGKYSQDSQCAILLKNLHSVLNHPNLLQTSTRPHYCPVNFRPLTLWQVDLPPFCIFLQAHSSLFYEGNIQYSAENSGCYRNYCSVDVWFPSQRFKVMNVILKYRKTNLNGSSAAPITAFSRPNSSTWPPTITPTEKGIRTIIPYWLEW